MTDLTALARHHGLTLRYDERAVPDATLRLILRGLSQDPTMRAHRPCGPRSHGRSRRRAL